MSGLPRSRVALVLILALPTHLIWGVKTPARIFVPPRSTPIKYSCFDAASAMQLIDLASPPDALLTAQTATPGQSSICDNSAPFAQASHQPLQ